MPEPVDFFEITLIWKPVIGVREATCSFGAFDLTVGTPRSATDMADDMWTLMTTANLPCDDGSMIDDWQFNGVSVAFGTSTGDIIGQHLQVVHGTVTDNCPPNNLALLVTKNTGAGGRRNRGRMFVPPIYINEGAVDSVGVISGSTLSSNSTYWGNVIPGMAAIDVSMMLFHQGAGAPSPTGVTSLTVQALAATQRRRMRS
jgi:hypothetical protein